MLETWAYSDYLPLDLCWSVADSRQYGLQFKWITFLLCHMQCKFSWCYVEVNNQLIASKMASKIISCAAKCIVQSSYPDYFNYQQLNALNITVPAGVMPRQLYYQTSQTLSEHRIQRVKIALCLWKSRSISRNDVYQWKSRSISGNRVRWLEIVSQ